MNEKGFTTVSVILWTPLILAITASMLWTHWFLNQSKALENICHQGVMKSQEIIVKGNNNIMALNKKAWFLFLEKKALNVAILTGPPPVKAAAKIRKKMVIASQKTLKKQQQYLFKKSNFLAKIELYKLRANIQKKTRNIHKYWGTSVRAHNISIQPTVSQLKIKIYDVAPIYKRKTNHSTMQKIKAQWRFPLKSMMPQWLLKLVPIYKHWEGACFSHPHSAKGGFQWRAAIGKGNH